MKISEVVDFLEKTKEAHGDIRIQTLTGFWIRTIPASGETVVVCAIGDAQSLEDALKR